MNWEQIGGGGGAPLDEAQFVKFASARPLTRKSSAQVFHCVRFWKEEDGHNYAAMELFLKALFLTLLNESRYAKEMLCQKFQ